MAVECHVCYEALIQGQKALALQCGHVCCGSCLGKWLQNSEQDDKRCPVCRYLPELGEAPRPVFLRFAEGTAPRTRTLVNLDDAIKNGEGLKALVTGLSDAENLTAHELTTMLDDALNVHVAMQDLCRVRELQEVMSDVSTYLEAIKDDLPRFKDDLEWAEQQLKQQTLVEEELQRNVEINEEQIRTLEEALNDQKQNYESKLEGSQMAIDRLYNEKEELEANYLADRKGLQVELASSELLIVELGAAVEKIKASIIGCKSKIKGGISEASVSITESHSVAATVGDIQATACMAENSGTTWTTWTSGQSSESVVSGAANTESRSGADAGGSPLALPKPLSAPEAEVPRPPERLSPVVPIVEGAPQPNFPPPFLRPPSTNLTGPWTALLNTTAASAKCAAAFVNYYNALFPTKSIEIRAIEAGGSARLKYVATAQFGDRQVLGKGKSPVKAQHMCAQLIWPSLSKSNRSTWEQFVQSPAARVYWK